MYNFRVLLPLLSLVGLIAGFLMMLSPFFIPGGVVCMFDDLPPDAWLNHLIGFVFSILLGIAVMVVSGVLAVTFGIVFAVEAASKAKTQMPTGGNIAYANPVDGNDSDPASAGDR